MDILSNPWVVGIGGGILSGVAVTLVSRFLLSRRDKSEYLQKLVSANRELIYAIRPGISEGVIPSRDVVRALISATARRYGVERRDVYSPREIVQELVKEVMDSSFISAKSKEEYCNRLNTLIELPAPQLPAITAAREISARTSELAGYRARMVSVTSAMLGFVAMVMTIYATFLEKGALSGLASFRDKFSWLLPALLTVMVVAIANTLAMAYRSARGRHDEPSRKSEPPTLGMESPEKKEKDKM